VVADTADKVGEIGLRVHAIQLATLDQGEEDRGALAVGVGTEEGPVASPEREGADGAFGGVVGHLQPSVIGEATERLPTVPAVLDGFGQVALAANAPLAGLQIGFEVSQQQQALGPAHGAPGLGAFPVDPALDSEDGADLLQRLKGDGRLGLGVLESRAGSNAVTPCVVFGASFAILNLVQQIPPDCDA
jgi:hypothetical protein